MNDYQKYAPLGLVVSGLAVFALIATLIVQAVSNAGLITLPDPELLNRILIISASLVVVGLAVTALLNPEGVRVFLTGRQVQYGSNAIITLLAFLGILVFANILAFQNNKTWDISDNGQNTLAPETLEILAGLPEPVAARAYYSASLPTEDTRKLLEKFRENSNGKFQFEFIDPQIDFLKAESDQILRDGTVVLEMAGRKELVIFPNEQNLDSALIRLANPDSRVVYFLTGHGEIDPQTPGQTSHSAIRTVLESKNYTVRVLNLAASGSVPEDANAVLIGGPRQPLLDSETQALRDYLARGGGLIVLREPKILLGEDQQQADILDSLLAEWGISFNNDLVIDPNANPALVAIADPQAYASHPITADLRGLYTFFPTSSSIRLGETAENIGVAALASSGTTAWGETDLASVEDGTPAFDDSADNAGPLILAAVAQDFVAGGRIVVFSDDEFAMDDWFQRGNGDILVNAVDWTAGQEQLISLTPTSGITRTYVPPSLLGFIGIIITSLCLVPLGVVGAGAWVWFTRRRRG